MIQLIITLVWFWDYIAEYINSLIEENGAAIHRNEQDEIDFRNNSYSLMSLLAISIEMVYFTFTSSAIENHADLFVFLMITIFQG